MLIIHQTDVLMWNTYILPVYVCVNQSVLLGVFKDHVVSIQKCLLQMLEFIICKQQNSQQL